MKRLPALLAALLAGCASAPQWHKAGAAPESIEADVRQCRLSAPLAPRQPASAPRTKQPGGSMIDFNTMAEREGDRMLQDERHVSECMRAKGYSDAAK